MNAFQSGMAIFVALVGMGAGVGCTANVENPKVNQNAGDETMCTKTCDDTLTSCTAKCSDDACKATCTSTHQSCVTTCSPADGG